MYFMAKNIKSSTKSIRIPPSKYSQDKDKSEAQITLDHVAYCHEHNILFFHTKVKGEPHMGKNGLQFMKKSENQGFFDMLLTFMGSVTLYLELKAGKGGIWSGKQINQYNKVIKSGGFALCSNSIRDTHKYLLEKGLVK